MRWRRFGYSVSAGDVERFVEGNECVREFLSKYAAVGTRLLQLSAEAFCICILIDQQSQVHPCFYAGKAELC